MIIFCCPEKKKRLFLIAFICETGNIMISKGISMYCVYGIMKKNTSVHYTCIFIEINPIATELFMQ